MVQFINLPGYQPSPLMDFSQINQAFNNRREQGNEEAKRALLLRAQAEKERQFNEELSLSRDKFKLSEAKSPYELKLLEAEAATKNAHAGYYRSQSALAGIKMQPPRQDAGGPVPAIRPDGTGYFQTASDAGGVDVGGGAPRQDSQYLDSGSTVPPTSSREHMNFGQYGMKPADVPGVVVNPQGGTDQPATRAAAGQRALDNDPRADRERMLKFQQTQDLWTGLHRQPPRAGMMYDDQGREVAKGPMTNSADAADRRDRGIGEARKQIAEAEKVLLSGWAPEMGRATAGTMKDLGAPGRFINNIAGLEPKAEALDKMKHGVLQTVYALSGKQTTNKEMDHFLSLYMPLAGESDDLIKSKSKRLQKMLGTLQSGLKKGMIYEEAERAAVMAADDEPQKKGGKNPPQTNGGNDLSGVSTEELLRRLDNR